MAATSTSATAAPGWPTAGAAANEGAQKEAARLQSVVVPGESCPPNQACLRSPKETDGDHAAYVIYVADSGSNSGPGPYGCYIYVYQDSAGWHFYEAVCTQNDWVPERGHGMVTPGPCGNVREAPSLQARVIKCLPERTDLNLDGGPTWADSHMWWDIKDSGWMAHDNLVLDFRPGGVD